MHAAIFSVFLVTSLSWCFASLDEKYSFKSVLHNKDRNTYILHWKFSTEDETITFAVNVSTTGWVGFGLSPNGGMAGSDVVIGWVKDQQAHFHVSEWQYQKSRSRWWYNVVVVVVVNLLVEIFDPFFEFTTL